MKRPSFQFYPGDWQSNSNLKRCTRIEKSVWLDVLCLMHDQEEYGVLRWPLKDIAEAASCKVAELKALHDKGVLKGADKGEACPAYVYVPRSGRKEGDPVILIPEQNGPIWFSSRFIRDEYVRTVRGEGSRFGGSPNDAPIPPFGEDNKAAPIPPFGDGSSSSSSSSKRKTTSSPSRDDGVPIGFVRFWEAWPSTERKVAKSKCAEKWRKAGLDTLADQIVGHVEAMRGTRQWREGYEPAPLTYLNQRRWEDGVAADSGINGHSDNPFA